MSDALYLGIDFGTGGVRASLIDHAGSELDWHSTAMPAPVQVDGQWLQHAQIWLHSLEHCLNALRANADFGRLRAIAVDGTSSSVLLCGKDGEPLCAAIMYRDSSAQAQARQIAALAPPDSGAHGASSSLAKLLLLRRQYPKLAADHFCHQADFISGWLRGHYGHSDENNCLKLGYDAYHQCWPEWLGQLDFPPHWLPEVHRPGRVMGSIDRRRAAQFGIAPDCAIVAGTTDSIAAFIATGACRRGDAVTSLGSTLVLKQLTDTPVFSAAHGVYSHRYYAADDLWLAGGASNCGGSVLREHFSQTQLDAMTTQLDPDTATGLDYYPLPADHIGERFPVADTTRRAQLSPRPADDVVFFQAILEALADIEAEGYALLQRLGAGAVQQIFSAGGGSRNTAWHRIRAQRLPCPLHRAPHTEASYGAALLARFSFTQQ